MRWMTTAAKPILLSARRADRHSSNGVIGRSIAGPCSARASGITGSPAIIITERRKTDRKINEVTLLACGIALPSGYGNVFICCGRHSHDCATVSQKI